MLYSTSAVKIVLRHYSARGRAGQAGAGRASMRAASAVWSKGKQYLVAMLTHPSPCLAFTSRIRRVGEMIGQQARIQPTGSRLSFRLVRRTRLPIIKL